MSGEWQPFWYLLAGFILGFATSTLWEWLYFRRWRLDAASTTVPDATLDAAEDAPATTAWVAEPAYRSPPIFIEGEQITATPPAPGNFEPARPTAPPANPPATARANDHPAADPPTQDRPPQPPPNESTTATLH